MLLSHYSQLARCLERRLPESGLERGPGCHPERSEGSLRPSSQTLRFAQGDRHALQVATLRKRRSSALPGRGAGNRAIKSESGRVYPVAQGPMTKMLTPQYTMKRENV